jgi:hypothetical protein
MSDDSRLDERIARLVRGADRNIPPGLEARVRAAAETANLRRGGRVRRPALGLFSRRALRILALVPGAAAAAALAAFLLVPALRKPPASPIAEIRTEFEIADKNIKIVFFQNPDFNLSEEE